MTPGLIWETILELKKFTFQKLMQACLEKLPHRTPATERILRGKIQYMLMTATREGRLVRRGRRYSLPEGPLLKPELPPELYEAIEVALIKYSIAENVKNHEKVT